MAFTYDAFTDPEMRYRQRYADLVVNPHVKEVFVKRTKLFNAMRSFFNDAGYFEVENPCPYSPFLEEPLQDLLLHITIH